MNKNETELIKAIEKSLVNSEDLISDAKLLQDNERFARAYTLYQLSIEECGKAVYLFTNILFGPQKDFEKNFTNHILKAHRARMLTLLYGLEMIKTDKIIGEQIIEWTLLEIKEAKLLNDYKNYSLYTSFIGNSYRTPSEIITEENVNYIMSMAINRLAGAKTFLEIGTKHLNELKEHLGSNPINDKDINNSIKNLIENDLPIEIVTKVFGVTMN